MYFSRFAGVCCILLIGCDAQVEVVKLASLNGEIIYIQLRPRTDPSDLDAAIALRWPPTEECQQLPPKTKVTLNGVAMNGSPGSEARGGACYYPHYQLRLHDSDFSQEGKAEFVINDGDSSFRVVVPRFLSKPGLSIANGTSLEKGAQMDLALHPEGEITQDAAVNFFKSGQLLTEEPAHKWRADEFSEAKTVTLNGGGISILIPADADVGAGILRAEVTAKMEEEVCEGPIDCEVERTTIRVLETRITESSLPPTAPTF